MKVVAVLVKVNTPYGPAGVVQGEHGALWLSHRVDQVSGTRLDDYRPAHAGIDDQTLIGGRLPPGAVGAEVVDDAGRRIGAAAEGGAWVALLDQPISGPIAPAWCFDASGAPVAPPLPAEWARRRVENVDRPCPACGRTAWDEVTATDDSRGMRSTGASPVSDGPPEVLDLTGCEPTPFVVCCAFGNEESIASIMRLTTSGDEDPAESERRIHQAEQRRRQERLETLTSAQFPIFADQQWPAKMCGWGSSDGVTTAITVDHDVPGSELRIRAEQNESHHRSDYRTARLELEHWLIDDLDHRRTPESDAALTVARLAPDRARRQRAATATREEVRITVDGAPEPFVLLRSGNRWVATRTRASQNLTIFAADVDPAALNLRPILDPPGELQ